MVSPPIRLCALPFTVRRCFWFRRSVRHWVLPLFFVPGSLGQTDYSTLMPGSECLFQGSFARKKKIRGCRDHRQNEVKEPVRTAAIAGVPRLHDIRKGIITPEGSSLAAGSMGSGFGRANQPLEHLNAFLLPSVTNHTSRRQHPRPEKSGRSRPPLEDVKATVASLRAHSGACLHSIQHRCFVRSLWRSGYVPKKRKGSEREMTACLRFSEQIL